MLADGSTVPNGLGVGVAPDRGLDRIGQNGGDAGYRSSVSYFSGPAVGVAVLANAAEFQASLMAGRVVAALLNLRTTRNKIIRTRHRRRIRR